MSDIAIRVEKLGKLYRIGQSEPYKVLREVLTDAMYAPFRAARSLLRGPRPAMSQSLSNNFIWALKDVSFEVKKGETLGIIGPNGAGKSTILKLLARVTEPTEGDVYVNGRVTTLIEIGAGFHPELTGGENIYLNGAVLGMSKKEVEAKFKEIVDFAELWEFIDTPVKHYSSGMYVRLGFAVAVHTEPEILSVDEVLAVGDSLFQAKCFAKFRELKEKGITIIFVTHRLDLVSTHCSHALLLDKGIVLEEGTPKAAIDQYNRLISSRGRITPTNAGKNQQGISNHLSPSKEIEWRGLFRVNPNEDRYGTKQTEILEAGIFTLNQAPVQLLERNQEYLIKVKVCHNERMPASIVSYMIRDPKGTVLCGTNTFFQNIEMGQMEKGEVVLVTFKQIIRLNPSEYLLCLGSAAFEQGVYVVYDRRFEYMPFQVVGNEPRVGLFDPDSVIEWARGN